MLALSLQKGMLPQVGMKSDGYNQLSSLAQTRDRLVEFRTVLKNKTPTSLSAHGIQTRREAYSSDAKLEKVLELELELELKPVAKVEWSVIVEHIRHLNKGIARLDQELSERGKKLSDYGDITSIECIGPKSGTVLPSVIGNIRDFGSQKKLPAYVGMVPRVDQSNQSCRYGHVTKRGSALGRTTLVQCTLVVIRYPPYLRPFYERLKSNKGNGKATIAIARKLLGIVYQTPNSNWVFEALPDFVLKATWYISGAEFFHSHHRRRN